MNENKRVSDLVLWLVLGVAAVAAVALALSIGAGTVWPTRWFASGSLDAELVRVWRAPRVAAAFFVGACLSLAGLVFQGVFRNPLARALPAGQRERRGGGRGHCIVAAGHRAAGAEPAAAGLRGCMGRELAGAAGRAARR
jgi:ABC-type Fe3+-siderophore transport system permease subunit